MAVALGSSEFLLGRRSTRPSWPGPRRPGSCGRRGVRERRARAGGGGGGCCGVPPRGAGCHCAPGLAGRRGGTAAGRRRTVRDREAVGRGARRIRSSPSQASGREAGALRGRTTERQRLERWRRKACSSRASRRTGGATRPRSQAQTCWFTDARTRPSGSRSQRPWRAGFPWSFRMPAARSRAPIPRAARSTAASIRPHARPPSSGFWRGIRRSSGSGRSKRHGASRPSSSTSRVCWRFTRTFLAAC